MSSMDNTLDQIVHIPDGKLEIGNASSGETPIINTITASGRGEVKIRPDSMRVTVGVSFKASKLDDARNQVNAKMASVTQALTALSLPGLVLETQTLYFQLVYSTPSRVLEPTIVAYLAANNVEASLTAEPDTVANLASKVVDQALAVGANNVGGVSFYLNDTSEPESRALALAVANARKDAETIAQAAGVTLAGVHSIEKSSGRSYRPYGGAMMMAASTRSLDTPMEAGETTITGSVTARYLIGS